MSIVDYYTPSDVFSYTGKHGQGRCINDEDLGSGGVLLFPDAFYNGLSLVVVADKESNLYFEDRSSLGHFNSSGGNNVQTITTPPIPTNDLTQGYWASPAYLKYTSGSTTYYMLYYSATEQSNFSVKPKSLNGYQLLTSGSSGPIASQTPTVSTSTLFCYSSPTPSVSSNGTASGTGIVWAIENQNKDNPRDCSFTPALPAALHAFDATTLNSLYSSAKVATQIGNATTFSTPTVFQGRVYMGTRILNASGNTPPVDVFGLCSSQQSGCL